MSFPSVDNLMSQSNQSSGSQDLTSQTEQTSSSNSPTTSSAPSLGTQGAPQAQAAQALIDLDKADKAMFQGKEWSRKDLEAAIMKDKDYRQKTMELANERKTVEAEKANRKFYENLYHDLKIIEKRPDLATEFIKLYPKEFHPYVKQVLDQVRGSSSDQGNQSSQSQGQGQQRFVDVDVESRFQTLESKFHEQEVIKNEQFLESNITKFTQKYPDAIPELAIANLYEARLRGEEITAKLIEDAFKDTEELFNQRYQAKYSGMVKKQSAANNRSKDVDAGGGTPGRAPQKFKSLGDVTKFAIDDLTGKMGKG